MKPYILFTAGIMVLVISVTACGTAGPGVPQGAAPAPSAVEQPVTKLQEITQRGMLIVSVKKDESPTGEHRDVAHFQKRDFEISIAKAIAKKLLGDENKIEVKMFPRVDRVPAVERNEVDLAISAIAITDDLRKQVNFSDTYAWEGLSLMTKRGAGIRGLDDLTGKTVGSNTEGGVFFGDELVMVAKERGLEVNAKSYDSFEDAASAVETGQLPAMTGRRINMLVYMTQKPGIFELAGEPLTIQEYGIAIKKGNNDLLELVNSVIRELIKSGELKQFAEKASFPIAHTGPAPALSAPSPVPSTTTTTPTPTPAPTPVIAPTPTPAPIPGSGTGGGTGGGGGGGGKGAQ